MYIRRRTNDRACKCWDTHKKPPVKWSQSGCFKRVLDTVENGKKRRDELELGVIGTSSNENGTLKNR